jgi:hypothetical protein
MLPNRYPQAFAVDANLSSTERIEAIAALSQAAQVNGKE